jgi:hypothetical protein
MLLVPRVRHQALPIDYTYELVANPSVTLAPALDYQAFGNIGATTDNLRKRVEDLV